MAPSSGRPATFHDWVTADGSSAFPAESGRYHLYVSLACPWAHRTIIVRHLKGLEDVISHVGRRSDPRRARLGLHRRARAPTVDPLNGFHFLAEAYVATDPAYPGRVTVPVLWDKQTHRIVNNESAEIIRMLSTAFDAFTDVDLDLYPRRPRRRDRRRQRARLRRPQQRRLPRRLRTHAGRVRRRRATTCSTRSTGSRSASTDRRYLVGTAAHARPTGACSPRSSRFDPVYVTHFRCDRRRIVDYPALSGYLRDLYAVPGVAETVDFDQIRRHYFLTHHELNPRGILPIGPDLDLTAPHGREALA